MLPAAVERWRPLAAQAAADAAAAYGVPVPVNLVLAIVSVESRGNPAAKLLESDGEYSRGLMQVKESTARGLGLSNPETLTTPAVGLKYGARYLAFQLKRYGGNSARAAAAYNAGSVRYTSGDRFINQSYVDKAMAALRAAGAAARSSAGWIVPAGIATVVLVALLWSPGGRSKRRAIARAAA